MWICCLLSHKKRNYSNSSDKAWLWWCWCVWKAYLTKTGDFPFRHQHCSKKKEETKVWTRLVVLEGKARWKKTGKGGEQGNRWCRILCWPMARKGDDTRGKIRTTFGAVHGSPPNDSLLLKKAVNPRESISRHVKGSKLMEQPWQVATTHSPQPHLPPLRLYTNNVLFNCHPFFHATLFCGRFTWACKTPPLYLRKTAPESSPL